MLELKNISKLFPGVRALDDVSLTFKRGEIHALMGENGAGKSTLIKIITGIYQPDLGSIWLDGNEIHMSGYQECAGHDIAMVSQEIQVIPEATVAENIVLDKLKQFSSKGKVDWKKVNETAKTYLDIVGLDISPHQKIDGLTAAQKQLIQIAKALSSKASMILLDEPTSSLSVYESNNLIQLVKKLKEDGVGVIFVSHKIEEVLDLCDVVSVLRDGKYVGTRSCTGIRRNDIVKMMIGREEDVEHLGFLEVGKENVLEARKLVSYGNAYDISFELKKGEILGFYGLVGSGRTETAKIIIGADKMDEGEIFVNGEKASIRSVSESLDKYRIGYVSENRKEEGLILDFAVGTNLTVTALDQLLERFRKISVRKEGEVVQKMVERMKIKTPEHGTAVGTLSGGNQQKVSIGKWLTANCDILIIDEPSVGVDVGAKKYIHELIWKLAKEDGKSIILISSDMPELITLSRRILVFKEKRIAGEITGLNQAVKSYEEVSEQIGALMA